MTRLHAVASPTEVTLDEVRTWPPTVDVTAAARALGVSRAHAYDLAKRGELPVRTIKVGSRIRVITSSLVALLDDAGGAAPAQPRTA